MAVYVVGMGAVTPFGKGVAALWQGLLEGRSALKPASVLPHDGLRNTLVGEVAGYTAATPSRAVQMLLDAAGEALAPIAADHERLAATGMVLGTNFGAMSRAETGLFESPVDLDEYEFDSAVRHLRARYRLGGPAVVLSLSCASGLAVLRDGMLLLAEGACRYVLAGGFDELSRYALVGLSALRAVTADTVKPFAADRSGTIFSEGAGCLLLAAERPAGECAELLAVALNNDAYHLTAPEKTGAPIERLVRQALQEASAAPEDIDYINAHATGTPYNDANEHRVFRAVFGERALDIPVSANKGALGHLMGAAGAVETIAAMQCALTGTIPPNVNSEPADPAIALDIVRGAPRRQPIRKFLKCSYGIGGTNACAVFAVSAKD